MRRLEHQDVQILPLKLGAVCSRERLLVEAVEDGRPRAAAQLAIGHGAGSPRKVQLIVQLRFAHAARPPAIRSSMIESSDSIAS